MRVLVVAGVDHLLRSLMEAFESDGTERCEIFEIQNRSDEFSLMADFCLQGFNISLCLEDFPEQKTRFSSVEDTRFFDTLNILKAVLWKPP